MTHAPDPETSSARDAAEDVESAPEASDSATAASQRAAPSWEPLDADGRERPAFVLRFPRDPDLDVLVQAFLVGNYRLVRQRASALAEATGDDQIREAALELRRRIDPDPVVLVLLGLSVAAFALLVLWTYLSHGH